MVQVQKEFGSSGVEFIGITDVGSEELDDSKAFLEFFGINWPNAYGAGESMDAMRFDTYGLMVVGADGRVIWNDMMGGDVEDAVEAALWLRDHPE